MEAIARLTASAGATTLVLVGALGASAGIHGGLFAAHLADDRRLALSFLAAAVALVAAAAAVAFRPGGVSRAFAIGLTASLLAAYVAVSHDPFDALAAVTKTIEGGAFLLALTARRLTAAEDPGTPVGVLALTSAVGLFLAVGHGH